jgi:nucleotide-binding universal stress UspA family protein
MEIKKLLFVTKFEALGFDALRSLLNLREAALEHVIFLNVIERERVAMHRGVGYQKSEEIRLREAANIRFIDWAEELFETGMEVGVYIVVGHLVPQVIKAAEKEEADLIVIGRSLKGPLEQLYAGSDVTELLRRTAIPVLVYKQLTEDPTDLEQPFKRPLLATDWSPAGMKAVEYLKGIAKVTEEINVLNVVDEKQLVGTTTLDVQKTRKEVRGRLEEICEALEAAGCPRARARVYVGDAEEEIERAARDCQSTMIVLGSSARQRWVEKFLGSIPRAIAKKSVYPTLLIPPEK